MTKRPRGQLKLLTASSFDLSFTPKAKTLSSKCFQRKYYQLLIPKPLFHLYINLTALFSFYSPKNKKMSFFKTLPFFFSLFMTLSFGITYAARFDIRNNCPQAVWAAAVPGGGRKLNRGETWTLNVNPGTKQARIWARTKCNFDGSGGRKCETGDCGGLLECKAFGQPPNTLAEYALNQFGGKDFFDISLVDGFNVPMEFSPTSNGCSRGIKCTADINGQCPNQLKTAGGCNNPCTVFKTDEYCCNSGKCGPTNFSKFFKDRCKDAYSYPKDDQTSTFTCPQGTNYKVVFCP